MLKILSLILVFVFSFNVGAENHFNHVLEKYPRATISVYAKNITTNKVIFAFNEKKLMLPASTLKVITAYSALEVLKTDFTYQTKIFTDNKNNLYIKFSGDPSLTLENFEQLISKIPKKKFENLFIDDFIFDDQYYGDGDAQEDKKFCFSAPSSAIVINQNCFKGFLEPSTIIGQKAKLKFPEKIFAHIENKIITKKDPSCKALLKILDNNNFLLHGCIDINNPKINLNIAYQNPRQLIRDIIKDSQISLVKGVSFKEVKDPEDLKSVTIHNSPSLAEMIKIMLKDSNNLFANNIFKIIGTKNSSNRGSYSAASEKIYSILKDKINLSPDNSRIVDGSGASRYNLLAADQLVELMILASSNKIFRDALPIAREDGTLKDRHHNNVLNHNIVAKTGSLGNVLSLSGYINKNIVFAIMINGFVLPRAEAVRLEEQILSFLLELIT